MKNSSGALLAFLAWVIVAPGSAIAECSSHYVPTISLSNGSGLGLDSLGSSRDPMAKEIDPIPGLPKPCTGPMCSGKPAIPLSPISPKIARIGSWAILPVTVRLDPASEAETLIDDGIVRPIHAPGSIFHPPRLSSFLLTS